jgi:hypothetical protein
MTCTPCPPPGQATGSQPLLPQRRRCAVLRAAGSGSSRDILQLPQDRTRLSIGRKNKRASVARPLQKNGEAIVGLGATVLMVAVPEKAPSLARVDIERLRVGKVRKVQVLRAGMWVSAPKPFRSAEVGQAGIHTHARPVGDDLGDVDCGGLPFFHSS